MEVIYKMKMKRIMLAIGMMSLFIGMTLIPAGASVEKQGKTVYLNLQSEHDVGKMTVNSGGKKLSGGGIYTRWCTYSWWNIYHTQILFSVCAKGLFIFIGTPRVLDLSYGRVYSSWWKMTNFYHDSWINGDGSITVYAQGTFQHKLLGDTKTMWASVTCFSNGQYDRDGGGY